jgi:hypothetical protein
VGLLHGRRVALELILEFSGWEGSAEHAALDGRMVGVAFSLEYLLIS